MNFNDTAIEDIRANLNKSFTNIKNQLDLVISKFNNISDDYVWEGNTKDKFKKDCEIVKNNYFELNEKFTNISNYLDTVISNYKNLL